jgi:hypothetical protein
LLQEGQVNNMMEFLEFLNTADTDALKKVPGMTAALAEGVLAARPFSTPQDCARVKGLTAKKLASLEKGYVKMSEEEKSAEEPALVDSPEAAVEPVKEAEIEEPKPVRKGSAGRVITWIVVILLLAAAVFAVIKWGIPYIKEKYIKPVEDNAATITDLASQQSAEVTRLNEEITALQERLTTLEGRADAVDLSLQAHDETLAQLQNMQDLLDEKLGTQKSDLLEELSTQITLTRGVDLLSRSRLYLSESNFGLAKIDLETSRGLLYSLLDVLPSDQVDAMKMVINRIDMALESLPAYPVVAVYDVDTAWQLLIDGLPNIPAQAVTPVILPPTDEPTSTPTVELTIAPTPELTATP